MELQNTPDLLIAARLIFRDSCEVQASEKEELLLQLSMWFCKLHLPAPESSIDLVCIQMLVHKLIFGSAALQAVRVPYFDSSDVLT